MITVITNEHADIEYNANAYPGKSLAEACNQLQIDTINAINEFQMNLLLSEHAYLYENGHEISYVDEADGSINEKGRNVKENLANMITKIGDWVNEAFDKLVGWILQRVEDVQEFFAKKGLTKGIAKKGVDIYCDLAKNADFAKAKVTLNDVDFEAFQNEYEGKYGLETEFKPFECVSKDAKEQEIGCEEAQHAFHEVYDCKRNIIADIMKQKHKANQAIKELIREAKSKKDIDGSIDELKAAAKVNSDIARESIKIYHAYMSNQITIVRAVVLTPEVKKQIIGDAKNAVKEAPGKAKDATVAAAKKAGGAVADAGKKVGEGAKDLGGKAKKLFEKKPKEEKPAEDKVAESTVYDGKYFRV